MATTATTTDFGVELDFDTAEVREREDRERQERVDLEREAADKAAWEHCSVVDFLADAGLAPVSNVSQIDCMKHPAITHQWLTQQKSGWRMEAGTLLVFDENRFHDPNPLQPLWLLGHAWLWHEGREVLLDVTEPGWGPRLKEADIQLSYPETTTDIVRCVGRAQAAILPHLSGLDWFLGDFYSWCLYVPGIAPVEALKALGSDPDYVKDAELQFDLCGEHWRQLIATTREGRCCAEQARVFLGQPQQVDPCSRTQSLKPRGSAQMRQMENEARVCSLMQASNKNAQALLRQARVNSAQER